ncbi:MAG: TetR family transcriptional regulator [Acidobacteria bacterium]|jgi:AcrR family transcriptional regulator|nr:TetR family transcriptional regulator [Acidobacteriota bacterium]
MNDFPTTRERLLDAAIVLFARSGFKGAPVRQICDRARANPGSVSYHFGGKRQLYRAALRRVADHVSTAVGPIEHESASAEELVLIATRAVCHTLLEDDAAMRLILRDLAEGGEAVAEALAPALRTVFQQLIERVEVAGPASNRQRVTELLLAAMAPPYLLLGAWPVLERALDLTAGERRVLLERLLQASLVPPANLGSS